MSRKFNDLKNKKVCMCNFDKDSCSNVISSSHSISRSGSLSLISEQSHVLQIEHDVRALRRASKFQDALFFKKKGIREASTFFGFCSHHDTVLFRDLDALKIESPDFYWQLFYRTACFERHKKNSVAQFSRELRGADKGRSITEQRMIQFQVSLMEYGHDEGLKDAEDLKAKLESNRTSDAVVHLCFELDSQLPVAGVGCFQPDRASDGTLVQQVNAVALSEVFKPAARLESVCMAVIPADSKTLLCLLALREQLVAQRFIKIFESESSNIANTFVATMLLHAESVYFRPSYVHSLEESARRGIISLASRGIGRDISKEDVQYAQSISLFQEPIITAKSMSRSVVA